MSKDSTEADILRGFASAASRLTFLPGVGPAVAAIAGAALSLAADLSEAGRDAVFEIERVRSALKLSRARHEHWEETLRKRFGEGSESPPDAGVGRRAGFPGPSDGPLAPDSDD